MNTEKLLEMVYPDDITATLAAAFDLALPDVFGLPNEKEVRQLFVDGRVILPHNQIVMDVSTLPDAITEAAALRALNWPASRRQELRSILPSVPAGQSRIYQKTAVDELRNMTPAQLRDRRKSQALFTR